MNPNVDLYLSDGCGRCPYYKSLQCKVKKWRPVLIRLRHLVLDTSLDEEFKWSQPCYTFEGRNVLMVSAFKDYAFVAFFKGVLLTDSKNMLVAPGQYSQSSRHIRFTSVQEVDLNEKVLKDYIHNAIEIEKKGFVIPKRENSEPIPIELMEAFSSDPSFEFAFKALSPGRQRGYIIYFSQPKHSSTRIRRIKKYTPTIMKGEGMHDAYKSEKR